MRSYDILIEEGLFKQFERQIAPFYDGQNLFIITDEHVFKYYQKKIEEAFSNVSYQLFIVPPGEHSKSFKTYETLIHDLVQKGIQRKDLKIGRAHV